MRMDPIPAFRFHVEITGIIEGMFTDCSGLGAKRKIFKYKEGGVNNYTHQLPDRVEYPKVKLRRGLGTPELLNWFMEGVIDGKVGYTTISILVFGHTENGIEVVRRWELERAYPIKWTGPALKTKGKNVAIETLEIVHHGLTVGQNDRQA